MIFLLFFLSCHKQVDLKTALDPNNCFASLEQTLRAVDCDQLVYMTTNGSDTMIRCHKPDVDRQNEWDTYVFRLSHSEIPIPRGAEDFIGKHIICEDDKWRIEAYPPHTIEQ